MFSLQLPSLVVVYFFFSAKSPIFLLLELAQELRESGAVIFTTGCIAAAPVAPATAAPVAPATAAASVAPATAAAAVATAQLIAQSTATCRDSPI